MFFRLDDEQREIQELARKFAQNEIAPHADEWDEEHRFPREVLQPMAELGLAGLLVARSVRRHGSCLALTGALIYEELAQADMAHGGLALRPQHGRRADRRNSATRSSARAGCRAWLSGDALGAFSLSEAHAGSDATAIRATRARREGDDYVLNGSKYWVTNAGAGRSLRRDARAPTPKRLARHLHASSSNGTRQAFRIGKLERKMGLHSSPTGELIFENCRVPAANRLSAEGDGLKIALSSLDGGRVNIGAIAIGVAQAALDVAMRYAGERLAFGKPIGAFEGIQFMLADMAMKIEASRAAGLLRPRCKMDDGEPSTHVAAMAKCFATDAAMAVTTDAVQVLGGAGYVRDWPVERYMRDAKVGADLRGRQPDSAHRIARALLGEVASQ